MWPQILNHKISSQANGKITKNKNKSNNFE